MIERKTQCRKMPLRAVTFAVMAVVLAGCGGKPPAPGEIWDPYEAQNRRVHALNTKIGTLALRRASLPGPVGRAASNAANNLGLPAAVVNSLLQAEGEHAVRNGLRFVINSTIGLAGVFDPAGAMGVQEASTDFGATLARWGWGEGAYVELPVLGPSTERDALGRVVDLVIDPLNFTLRGTEAQVAAGVKMAGRIGDRQRYGDSIDSVLYESADSYAQTRLYYLQSRRHELGQTAAEDSYDPYEDPYHE